MDYNNSLNNSLTPQQWLGYLKQLEDSNGKESRFLVSLHNGKTYQVLSDAELKAAGSKVHQLSTLEIMTISQRIFFQAERQYGTHSPDMNVQTIFALNHQISKLGERLIAMREVNRNQIGNRAIRSIGWTFAALASVAGYGKDFETFMLESHQNFEKESVELRNILNSIQQSQIVKEVDKRLKLIPKTILEIQKDINEESLMEFISMHMMRNIEESRSMDQQCTPIFDKDMRRGVTFIRMDLQNKIADESPIPFKNLSSQLKVQMGTAALAELTEKPEDKRWESILQVAATQTSLTALFNSLKGIFISNITSDVWQEGDNFKSLVLEFGENLPPINLEIIRNPYTSEIEKVKVEIVGIGDIVKKTQETFEEDKGEIIVPQAIISKMTYFITLSEFKQPMIKDLSVSITSHCK